MKVQCIQFGYSRKISYILYGIFINLCKLPKQYTILHKAPNNPPPHSYTEYPKVHIMYKIISCNRSGRKNRISNSVITISFRCTLAWLNTAS